MKKLISSVNAHHEHYVAEAIEKLQEDGWEVTDITRKEKQKVIFGKDVTEITYVKQKKETANRIGF